MNKDFKKNKYRFLVFLVCAFDILLIKKILAVIPIWPGGGGGGSARADFNLRELPCYLSNTYETLPLLLEIIGEQNSGFFFFCQEYKLLPWQPDFRRHV